MNKMLKSRWAKPVVFLLCLVPLGLLVWRGFAGDLGANPAETLDRSLGDWALRFLIIGLAVTPVRRLFGLNNLARFRRMLGLFAFFYVIIHVSSYLAINQTLDWVEIWKDITKRYYIIIGMATLLMLIPLAMTSTKGMIKRLGGKRWTQLHKLVYPAAIAGVVHYMLMIKADYRLPLIHGGILLFLLLLRLLPPHFRLIKN